MSSLREKVREASPERGLCLLPVVGCALDTRTGLVLMQVALYNISKYNQTMTTTYKVDRYLILGYIL